MTKHVHSQRIARKTYDARKAEASFLAYQKLKIEVDGDSNLRSDPAFMERLNKAFDRFVKEYGE